MAENTKESWNQADVYCIAGEIALMALKPEDVGITSAGHRLRIRNPTTKLALTSIVTFYFSGLFGPNDSSASSKPEAQMARPARIILLRHGEKKNASKLCSVGQLRAQALSDQYLGKGAPGNDTIFGKGGKPDAFFAITVHTQETATPSAQSWGKQLTVFSVPTKDPNAESDLNMQTEKAAAALASSEYDGKIIVVVWEHKHIAKKDLNRTGVTLWSLLNLGKIPDANVPETWEGVNYDYFWVMDYTNSEPTFTEIRQEYAAAKYAQVPNNAWGEPADKTEFPQFYNDCKSAPEN